MDIPVYLVTGFLDSGKTNFINGVLEDGFARQDKTLLLRCEEGEEEYNPNALDNVTACGKWNGSTGRFSPPTGSSTRS